MMIRNKFNFTEGYDIVDKNIKKELFSLEYFYKKWYFYV